jgi:hypothetical protein
VFGLWVVLTIPQPRGNPTCRCKCGFEATIPRCTLVLNKSKSCKNCSIASRDPAKYNNRLRHGCGKPGKQTPEYKVWDAITQRCTNPKAQAFHNYGARGIKLHPSWSGSGGFIEFLKHVGLRPTPDHSIDRIDNNLGYEPGNVRWTTYLEQTINRRNTITITIDGSTKTLARWAQDAGTQYHTAWGRIQRGWSPKEAIFGKTK